MVKNKKDIYYLTNKKNNFLTPNHEKRERFEFVFFHFLGVKIWKQQSHKFLVFWYAQLQHVKILLE